jgi:hypothetical protein
MQKSAHLPSQALFDALALMVQAWPLRGWSHDRRFAMAASSFSVELSGEARAAVTLALPTQWTDRTIKGAPAYVKQLADATGGVRPEQALYVSEPVAGLLAYGLWWPWGDETTISFRVGLAGNPGSREQAKFNEVFRLEPGA